LEIIPPPPGVDIPPIVIEPRLPFPCISGFFDPTSEHKPPLPMRLFYITETGQLTLKKLVIQNGLSELSDNNSGGAIFNQGKLILENIALKDNAAASYGGAIYSTGSLHIDSSTFTHNTAEFGGAIATTADAVINFTNITRNSAKQSGNGLYIDDSDVSITRSQFRSNFSETRQFPSFGGAISGSGTLTLDRISLLDNTASFGGAIHLSGTKD
jgi:predicted outer membrane repeat protein